MYHCISIIVLFAANPLDYRLLHNSMCLNRFIKAARFPRRFLSQVSEKSKSVSSVKWNSLYSLNTSAYSSKRFLTYWLHSSRLFPFSHTSYISPSKTSFLDFFDEPGTAPRTHSHISFQSTSSTAAVCHHEALTLWRTDTHLLTLQGC